MITLGIKDLDTSIQFYRDKLGLPMLDSPPGVAFFNLNGTWLGLCGRDHLAEDAGLNSAAGSGFTGITLSHNVATEAEVIKVFQEALAAGAEELKAPQKADWGGFHAYFKDPDGYLWEIAYNPFAWVGPEDKA